MRGAKFLLLTLAFVLLAITIPVSAQVATGGTITTVVGSASHGFSGDNGSATAAGLNLPRGVAVDSAGNIYVADTTNNRVRMVSGGIITTVAGNGTAGFRSADDGGLATSAELNYPTDVAVDGAGNLYIADENNNRVRKVTNPGPSGVITTYAGGGAAPGSCAGHTDSIGDGCVASNAALASPYGVSVDIAGNLYIADTNSGRIRKVNSSTQVITTVAGGGSGSCAGHTDSVGDGCLATNAALIYPTGVAVDGAGNIYIAGNDDYLVRVVNASTKIITAVAGNGTSGYTGDNGPATAAEIGKPWGIVVDKAGNLYISDASNNRIRKVSASNGYISTVVGNGTGGLTGDNGAEFAAEINYPQYLALDAAGNLYIADQSNYRIRKVQLSTGFGSVNVGQTSAASTYWFNFVSSTTVGSVAVLTQGASGLDFQKASGSTCAAGTYSSGTSCAVKVTFAPQFSGVRNGAVVLYDNASPANVLATVYISGTGVGPQVAFGPGVQSPVGTGLTAPAAIAVDGGGNVYIADGTGNQVVKAPVGDLACTTPADCTTVGMVTSPSGVAVDGGGNVFITEPSSGLVVEVPWSGSIYGALTTVASGLSSPAGIAVDGNANIFVTESSSGLVVKVPWMGSAYGTPSTAVSGLTTPAGAAVDGKGNIYIAAQNGAALMVDVSDAPTLTYPTTSVAASSLAQDVVVENVGNAQLNITQIVTATYFNLDGADTSCATTGQLLAMSTSCTLGIEFAPLVAGTVSGSVVLTDNTLNGTNVNQTVSLKATASQAVTTTTVVSSLTPQTYGNNVTFTATVAPGWPTGTVTFYDGATSLGVQTLDVNGQATLTTALLTAGTHTINASYSGDANYVASIGNTTQVINQAIPTVSTWPTAGSITYGQTLASSALGVGSASVPGSFAFTTPATVPVAGTALQSVTFTPTDATDYTAVIGSASVTVIKATPTISTWPTASTITYGQTLASSILTGGASTPAGGSYAFITPSTAPVAGTAAQGVLYTPADANDYNTVSGTVNVTVIKATPTVSTWPTASTITYGQTLASSNLSGGSASVPGSYAFTTPSTAPGAGTALQSVTFTPTDTSNYNTVVSSVNVTVNQATPTVTWPTAGNITYGQTLASSVLSGGTSSTPGSFAFTTPSTAPGAGTALQSITFTPTDATDYTNVVSSISVTVIKATPTVNWPTASAITYGQTLVSSTLSGGTSSTPGNFAFTTPSTLPYAGTAGQSVTFTPTDTTDYTNVVGSVSVTVNQQNLSVTVSPSAYARAVGAANPTFTGTPVGVVNNDLTTGNLVITYSTTAANNSTTIGSYPVTVAISGVAASSYSFTFTPGTLWVGNVGVDLIETATTEIGTAVTGGTIQATQTVLNQGILNAAVSTTGYYLSTDGVTKGSLLGTQPVSTLTPGANSGTLTSTLSLPTNLAGNYYVITCTNFNGVVVESITTNNCTATAPFNVAGADLVETTVSMLTANPTFGGSIQVSDTVTNQGGGAAIASTTGFYLSTDGVNKGTQLGNRSVVALAAGANSGPVTTTLTLPTNLGSGNYYVIACANYNLNLMETTTTNNCTATASFTVAGADYAESNVTLLTATPVMGTTIQVSDTVLNQGGGSAPASLTGFYISTDGVTKGAQLGSRSVVALAAGANSGAVTTTLTLPSGLSGVYYVIACANYNGAVTEINLANNCSATAAFGIGGADLIETGVTMLTASPAAGGSVQVSDTTVNQGGATAASSWTGFYLSSNGTSKGSYLGNRNVAALAAGTNSGAVTTTLNMPANLAGTFYVLACANYNQNIAESNTANNCTASAAFALAGADLIETSVTMLTAAPASGGSVQISDTAVNQGGGVAMASNTGFYLSSNGTSKGTFLGYRNVATLAAGANSGAVTTTLTLPNNLAGNYYVLACANYNQNITESNTANNCTATAAFSVAGADLVETGVTLVTASPIAAPAIQVSDTAVNQGGGTALASSTGFYLSTNGTTKGTYLGNRNVATLAAGANSGAVTTSLNLPSTLAAGTYYVIACANYNQNIIESITTNNCTATASFSVTY